MYKVKRTVSERSPDSTSNKKVNISVTPQKLELILEPAMEEDSAKKTDLQARDEAFKTRGECP